MNIREHINLFENENDTIKSADIIIIKLEDFNEILNATGFGIFDFSEQIHRLNPDNCDFCGQISISFMYNPHNDTLIIDLSALKETEHKIRLFQQDFGADYTSNNEQDNYAYDPHPNFIGTDSDWDSYEELQLMIEVISTLNKFKNYFGTNKIKRLFTQLDELGGAQDFVKRYGSAGLKQFIKGFSR